MADQVERGAVSLTRAMREAGLWAYPAPSKLKPEPQMPTEWPAEVGAAQAALLALEDKLDGDEAPSIDPGTRARLVARRRELAGKLEALKLAAMSTTSLGHLEAQNRGLTKGSQSA